MEIVEKVGRVGLGFEGTMRVAQVYLRGDNAKLVRSSLIWTYDGKNWISDTGTKSIAIQRNLPKILSTKEAQAIREWFNEAKENLLNFIQEVIGLVEKGEVITIGILTNGTIYAEDEEGNVLRETTTMDTAVYTVTSLYTAFKVYMNENDIDYIDIDLTNDEEMILYLAPDEDLMEQIEKLVEAYRATYQEDKEDYKDPEVFKEFMQNLLTDIVELIQEWNTPPIRNIDFNKLTALWDPETRQIYLETSDLQSAKILSSLLAETYRKTPYAYTIRIDYFP